MVEKRNFVAEAGCTSGCDSHLLGGVRFLDDSFRPTLEPFRDLSLFRATGLSMLANLSFYFQVMLRKLSKNIL